MFTALTIAGSDSSGGAGIQADIKTMSALGVYAMSVITAITAQNTTGVYGVQYVDDNMIENQLNCVLSDIFPDAVKIGMLSSPSSVEIIAKCLSDYNIRNIVIDPVMVSTSGATLTKSDTVLALEKHLLPLATLITPNIPEAEVLVNHPIQSKEDMIQATKEIQQWYQGAILIKGGHFEDSPYSTDVLVTSDEVRAYSMSRIRTENTHGTGCTLSSAITAYYARGHKLSEAVGLAKSYLFEALKAGADVKLGAGHGPVNHFFKPEKQRFE